MRYLFIILYFLAISIAKEQKEYIDPLVAFNSESNNNFVSTDSNEKCIIGIMPVHNGSFWGGIKYSNEKIEFINGHTDRLESDSHTNRFDTTLLINNNKELLSWAFQKMINKVKIQGQIEIKERPLGTMYFYFIDSSSIKYIGNSDDYSNEKCKIHSRMNKLYLLLFWISSPDVRPYLPFPSLN